MTRRDELMALAKFRCIGEHGCRSPLACSGWGYCRERNMDGLPIDERGIARRRRDSALASQESGK